MQFKQRGELDHAHIASGFLPQDIQLAIYFSTKKLIMRKNHYM